MAVMLQDSDSFPSAETQLEQELRQMFELDSQQDLETYFACVEQMQPESWIKDIQKMYRAIHTIKGGAVTVKADAVLSVAMVLEELLSDLRYLEVAPPLEDGKLTQVLHEGGEILASALAVQDLEQKAKSAVPPKVRRIQTLRGQIQENYLRDWSEEAQLQREFAEEGLELVVLDLQIALNELPEGGPVPETTIQVARELLEQLQQIGEELQLASGWTNLLEDAQHLLEEADSEQWRSQWPIYFQALKSCAKDGGKTESLPTSSTPEASLSSLDDLNSLLAEIDISIEPETESEPKGGGKTESLPTSSTPETSLSGLEDLNSLLAEINISIEPETESEPKGGGKTESLPTSSTPETSLSGLEDLNSLLAEIDISTEPETESEPFEWEFEPEPLISNSPSLPQEDKAKGTEKIQIPVPLERLEKSAQSVIEALLGVRATEGLYQNLHHYLIQLVTIAKDNVQYITQLRQIQDDYAVLDDLDRRSLQAQSGPTPEKYRKGYITINRLLENSLRLSEIGAEAEETSLATAEKLQKLSSSILQLKDTVEDSRLVPFKNLAFRIKAIVRDLVDRSGKPAQLVVRGEEIELDVGTARTLEPLLLHLIRNAYDHGLETREERIKNGKSEQSTITLSLQRYGSSLMLQVQDNGRGIDAQAVSKRAEQLKLPLKRTTTQDELLAVICQPGFSSQTQVTEISGRGVGMDVVANQIASLGGYLSLNSKLGEGTTFYLHFPVPNLLVPCLLLQAGELTFAVPTEQIVSTSLWASLDSSPVHASNSSYSWEVRQGSTVTAAVDLLSYWHPRFSSRTLSESAIAVYIKSQQEQSAIWLIADKILGQSELQIRPLPSPLTPPLGLMGVSLNASGFLMPVIEVNSFIEKYSQAPTNLAELEQLSPEKTVDFASVTTYVSQSQQQSRTILIVDDAALMRRRIEASISAYGYDTQTCADGLEAWNWLQTNPNPALLITDIEMPNLDGFSLISRCRQENLTFPILVISSRLTEEWGQEARRLGANDFLTKGFSTAELINRVNALLSGE
jgi:chemotaxis protein histidine kinase CheA/CheY-like chemotaxis protein